MTNGLHPRHILIAGALLLLAVMALRPMVPLPSNVLAPLEGEWRQRSSTAEAWRSPAAAGAANRPGGGELWLRTGLPAALPSGGALFVPPYTAFQSFEVLLGERLLYRSGGFPARFADRHRYHLWHLINLPPEAAGAALTFHFSSRHPTAIGLIAPVYLGDPVVVFKALTGANLLLTVMAALFLAVGIVTLAAARFGDSRQRGQPYAFVRASLGAGCYLFTESDLHQMVLDAPLFTSYLHYFSFFLFVSGIGSYLVPLLDGPGKRTLAAICRLLLLYPLAASLLDISGLVSWDSSFYAALWLVMAIALWVTWLLYSPGMAGAAPRDTALIRAGAAPLLAAGLLDGAAGLRLLPGGPLLYPWGVLVLMATLLYRILERHREERLAALLQLEQARRAGETAIAGERRRIAMEIHDGLAQDLAMMNMRASVWERLVSSAPEKMAAEIELFRNLLRKNIAEVRRAIFAMRPVELEEAGFAPALARYVTDFGRYSDLAIDLEMAGAVTVAPKLETELFRIIQECLNNVAKHARASGATVRLAPDGGDLLVTVTDNGAGFDPERLAGTHRLGLRQMRERVDGLRGVFQVRSAPGSGTVITVRFPGGAVPG